jgi:phosphate starvation-inducible PhoH-like protein
MTESPQARTTVVVPASQPMVAVLGPRDELLRVVETAFPTVDISVRGNEISLRGEPGEVALVERCASEMGLSGACVLGKAANADCAGRRRAVRHTPAETRVVTSL